MLCYACTDPGSTSPPRAFFWQSESSKIHMHINCFVNFAAWNANLPIHPTLSDIFHAWALCNRCPHRTPNSRYLNRVEGSVRRITALGLVFVWQQEVREMWKHRRRTALGLVFRWQQEAREIWKQMIDQETHDHSSVAPSLVDSDSENDDRVPPAMLDASSDSDTSLVIIIHISRELH